MACFVHGQQGAEVGIGALLEAVELQRHRKLRLLHGSASAGALNHQMVLVVRQRDVKVLRQGQLLLQHPERGVDQIGAQDGMHRREQRPRALGREHRVGIQLIAHVLPDGKAHAALGGNVVAIPRTQVADELLVGGLVERGVDHMLVAQPGDLLGLEAFAERLLHIDEGELAREAVEDVGVGVAVFHALRGLVVHLVEVAADEHQQLAVVGLPGRKRLLKPREQGLHLHGRPLHDLGKWLLQLEHALEFLRVPGVELKAVGLLAGALLLVVVGALGLVVRVGQLALDVGQCTQSGRQAPVGQQRPHILVALYLDLLALGAHCAKALELVQHQHARCALVDAGVAQHARDGRAAVARAVAEAVHLHFDKTVVKAQQLRQAPRELGLARARQAPQADDDGAGDELGQNVPGADGIDHAVDHVVDAKQLGLELCCGICQRLLPLGQQLPVGSARCVPLARRGFLKGRKVHGFQSFCISRFR
ncbi:hypothetical protein D3C71_1037930 [compost metagenome]